MPEDGHREGTQDAYVVRAILSYKSPGEGEIWPMAVGCRVEFTNPITVIGSSGHFPSRPYPGDGKDHFSGRGEIIGWAYVIDEPDRVLVDLHFRKDCRERIEIEEGKKKFWPNGCFNVLSMDGEGAARAVSACRVVEIQVAEHPLMDKRIPPIGEPIQ